MPAAHADALELRYMAANADVQAGDMLTTSGVDGVYPPVCRWPAWTEVERARGPMLCAHLLHARLHWLAARPCHGVDRWRHARCSAAEPGPRLGRCRQNGCRNDGSPGRSAP